MPVDSLQAVAHTASHAAGFINFVPAGAPSREEAALFFDGWHEFYLLAGTAAVTLVGLLFVALSMHLDVLIHESRAHVLAHARATLVTFSYLLIVSLGVLIPHQSTLQMGLLLTVASLIVGSLSVFSMRGQRGKPDTEFERTMRRRTRVYVAGYVIALLTGIAMIFTGVPQLLFNLITVVCMMLGNAMGVSWDLLVELGKLKAELARQAESQRK